MQATIKKLQADIAKCDQLIEEGYATYNDVRAIASAYALDHPGFYDDLRPKVRIDCREPNEIDNIVALRGKLEMLLCRIQDTQVSAVDCGVLLQKIEELCDAQTKSGRKEKLQTIAKLIFDKGADLSVAYLSQLFMATGGQK